MKHFLLWAMTALSACGGLPAGQDGSDGAVGAAGVAGESPSCKTYQRDGKSYFRCENPNGTSTEVEIGGQGLPDNETPATVIAQCSYASELYSIRYNVLKVSDALRLASLAVTHLKTPKVFYQGAVLHAEGDEGYDAAEIKLSAWSAKLVGEKKAEVVQVGSAAGEMTCK